MTIKSDTDRRYTPRELEIIKLILLGKNRKQIADILGITIETVNTHIRHILLKTSWHSMTDLIIHLLSTDFSVNAERTEVKYRGELL